MPRRIIIGAYDSAKLMDISGPQQAFSDARLEDGRPAYQVTLASEAGGPVATDTGVNLEQRLPLRQKGDVYFCPEGRCSPPLASWTKATRSFTAPAPTFAGIAL